MSASPYYIVRTSHLLFRCSAVPPVPPVCEQFSGRVRLRGARKRHKNKCSRSRLIGCNASVPFKIRCQIWTGPGDVSLFTFPTPAYSGRFKTGAWSWHAWVAHHCSCRVYQGYSYSRTIEASAGSAHRRARKIATNAQGPTGTY